MNRGIFSHRTGRPYRGVFLIWGVLGLLLLAACGRVKQGELFGVVQMEKETNSEGILIFIPGSQFRAFTDANGSFLIAGIPPGEYEMVAQQDGYDESRLAIHILAGQRTTVGPLLLQRPYKPHGSLSGFITLEGETDHENISVALVGTQLSTTTNTTGYFQITDIAPGEYQLLALKDNWVPVSKSNIQVIDGEETQVLKFQLLLVQQEPTPTPPPPTLGDLILQGSAFLEGESIHAGIRVALADLPEKFTLTDATGAFQIAGLDDLPRSLILSHDGYLDETIVNAVPVSATSANSCGFITLQKQYQPEALGVLQGRVYLEGQIQHDNTTVQLVGVSPPVYTDAEGRYKFVGIPSDRYVLIAEHPGYNPGRLENVEINANQVAQAPDLTLLPAENEEEESVGGIVGLALLEGEIDQGGVLVAVQGKTLTSVTGSNGQFVFDKVPEGAYTLIFTKAGFKNFYLDGVQVLGGQNNALEPVILAKDVEPPYVVDAFPRDGARKIPINQFIDVIVRFSERMDARSVKQSILIDPPVGFDAFFDRESELSDLDTLHLRLYHEPPAPLTFDTRYQIVVTPEARTPKGVPMVEPFVSTFTTDGPLIVDSVPQRGESRLSLSANRKIMLMANAPVDQDVFERAVRFRPKPDSNPIIEFIPMGMGMQILIEANLRPNTRYRLQIDNGIRTVDRQRFSNTPFILNFRTEYTPESDQAQPGMAPPMRRRSR